MLPLTVDVLDLIQSVAILALTGVLVWHVRLLRVELRNGGQTLTAILASNEAMRLRLRDVEERMVEVEKRRAKKERQERERAVEENQA